MSPRRGRSWLERLLYFFNVLAALALLVAYLAFYLDPAWWPYPAFFGLAYPVLLLINLLFLLYWTLRLKPAFLLSALVIGLGYLHLMRHYQLSGANKVVNPEHRLKVMSFNVRLFNKYHWLPLEDAEVRIARLIEEQDPDLLLLQEYYVSEKKSDFGYPHRYQIFSLKEGNNGLVIFSKRPMEETGSIRYGPGPDGDMAAGRAIYADLSFGRSKIRVINTHLASVGFQPEDYHRLENPNEGGQEEIKQGFLKILKALRTAFVKRAHQVKVLDQAIGNSPYPVVLAGDFNDTPLSYIYYRLSRKLEDAYVNAGQGWVRTYAKGPVPFRIDHLFYSPELNALHYQVISEEYSDHYPIVTELEWR